MEAENRQKGQVAAAKSADAPQVEVTPSATPSLLERLRSGRPAVFNTKKKQKRRYSKELEGAQVGMRDLARISTRLVSAVSAGMREYRNREKKSSYKKKDGALRDFFKNSARGVSKTLRRTSDVPLDVVRAVRPNRLRKRLRRLRRRLFR